MADTVSITAGNIASLISGSGILSIDPMVRTLDLTPTPLIAWVGQAKPVKLDDQLRYRKIVQKRAQRTITNTVNIVTADTGITASTSDIARLQKNHLLLIDSEILQVTALTSTTTVAVTKGFAGTTSTTHATTSTMRIMSPTFADGEAFYQASTRQGEFKDFNPFIIQYSDDVSPVRTAVRTYLEGNQDPRAFRMEQLRKEKFPEFEQLLLHSRSATITGVAQSGAGTPAGIRQQIATNVTALSDVLTATAIENMLDTLYSLNGQRQITVMGTRTMHRIWSAVWRQFFEVEATPGTLDRISFGVNIYDSPTMGPVEFLVCDSCLDSELLFLTKGNWELHPLDWAFGTGWNEFTREVKEKGTLGTTTYMYSAWVFTCNDERLDGKLTGITTTGSSYAGFV